MKKGIWGLRIFLTGQFLLVSLLTGCGLIPSSLDSPSTEDTVPQSKSKSPGIIHFPEVISKEWVTSISSLCIQVDQSYTGVVNHTEPIAEELKGILDRIGVQTTIGENANCEAILRVKIEMTPVGEHVGGAGTCYFKASANGEATLSANGKRDLTLALSRQVSTGGGGFGITFVYSCPSKEDASFDDAWGYALAPMLSEWWGAPALVSALRSENYALSNGATSRLVDMGVESSGALPVLVEMLKDVDPNARESAARTLGEFGPAAAEAVPALIEASKDSDSGTKYEVVKALGKIGDNRAIPVLMDALQNNQGYLRVEVIQALGNMGEQAVPAIPELIKAVNDEDYSVARAAVEALGKIGPKANEAIPVLIELLEDGDKSLDYAAANALESITGQKFGEDAKAWRQWWNSK